MGGSVDMLREEGIDNIHLAYKTCYAGDMHFQVPSNPDPSLSHSGF